MNLRYVVVSDLHLGAANSILTCLTEDNRKTCPNTASDLLVQFAACLREVARLSNDGQPPTLVLNGDILELALAGTNEAAMTFRKFIEALSVPGAGKDWPFGKKVYYLPGNHDHHLWNIAREKQYREFYMAKTEANQFLEPEFQTTNMFNDSRLNPIPCDFLNLAVKPLPCAAGIEFLTVYPNFGLLNDNKTRCVVFHHGHYIESIYSLMTHLKKVFFPKESNPRFLWDLEAENGAWIDFFWSALGRSGQVGTDVELVYDTMQSNPAFHEFLDRLAKSLALMAPPKKNWSAALWAPFIRKALTHAFDAITRREVHQTDSPLSEDAQTGLTQYLENYVLGEIMRIQRSVPQDTTFVFGHTHKPFESTGNFKCYPKPVKLLNSGGWVVDTKDVSTRKGGAVIVVDEDLNVASVRMYNEHEPQQAASHVCVNAAGGQDNPLLGQLSGSINPLAGPWGKLSQLVEKELIAHRQNLEFHFLASD